MPRRALLAVTVGLAALAVRADAQNDHRATPIVVELFTSEGCSSCPPADAVLQQLLAASPVSGAEIVALGEHVDYWDALGWKDRFSSAALTARQQTYGRALNVDAIYTPQIVVDGRQEMVGSDVAAVKKALARALDTPHGRIRIDAEAAEAGALSVALAATELPPPAKGDRDEFVVAVTEDQLTTDVRRGENHGRRLSHAAVVRSLMAVGRVNGGQSTASARVPLARDWQRARLKVVAFVQEQRSRRIVAAASRAVPDARP
jgi:hypothetical protein